MTTYLDARANTVVVQLRHLAEAATGNLHRAIETSPAGSVRAEATWTPSYEATSVCNGAYCADGIMRGGFEIQSPEANQPGYVVICSAGFVANDSSGRPSLVTAGHCMPPSVSTGSWTDDQGVSVGVSDHYAYGGYYDAGDINMAGTTYAITLDPWILDYSYVTPQGCYVNCTTVSEDDQFVVTGTASAGQYVQGVYLCKDGRTTYHTCGSIDQLNVSENVCESGTSNCTTVNGFFGVNGMCSNGGDSGGPIFAPNSQASGGVAFGVVSNTNNYSTCPSGTETYSATMPNTVASLNVHILTGIAPASRPSDVIQV